MRDKPELRNSVNPPLTRAAKAKFDQLRPRDDPGARCMESGVGRMMLTASPLQIVAFDNHRPNIRMAETSCTENNIYDPTNPANGYSPDRPEVRALQLVATNEHFALIDKSALATLAIQAASQIAYALMHPGFGSNGGDQSDGLDSIRRIALRPAAASAVTEATASAIVVP